MSLFFFFFFQAEDGIRDVAVTGVQTCALPISVRARTDCRSPSPARRPGAARSPRAGSPAARSLPPSGARCRSSRSGRSEEHTSELQSRLHLVCRLLLEKKKKIISATHEAVYTS